MRRRTREEWREICIASIASGLSMDAFARQAGVNPRTLSWWRSQLRGKLDVPSFVEVSAGGGRVAVTGSSAGRVTLTVGSVVMTLDELPPAAWLAELAATC